MSSYLIPKRKELPELFQIENLFTKYSSKIRVKCEDVVHHDQKRYPLYSAIIGSEKPDAPCVAIFAGVHGLERVGTHVATAFLESLLELSQWDLATQELLKEIKIVFMPLVNPVGMSMMWRANGNGIDIMRNAPIDSSEVKARFPLVQGHRYGPWLPWYRGALGSAMETETQTITNVAKRELFESPVTLSIDIHSGFGRVDRLWFPYAKTKQPFGHIAQMLQFKELLDRCHPNHVYVVEPQSIQYTTHGDVWDFLYDEFYGSLDRQQHLFLPLSLEIGSWMWVKKNPMQLFSALGAFNPILAHRFKRVLRRHLFLLDFMLRAARSHKNWLQMDPLKTQEQRNEGQRLWWKSA